MGAGVGPVVACGTSLGWWGREGTGAWGRGVQSDDECHRECGERGRAAAWVKERGQWRARRRARRSAVGVPGQRCPSGHGEERKEEEEVHTSMTWRDKGVEGTLGNTRT